MSRRYRPLDKRLLTRAELLSRVHPRHVVAEIIGSSVATLYRASRREWREKRVGHPTRPMPSDFQIQRRHMTRTEMTRHYACSNRTVTRWLNELGAL